MMEILCQNRGQLKTSSYFTPKKIPSEKFEKVLNSNLQGLFWEKADTQDIKKVFLRCWPFWVVPDEIIFRKVAGIQPYLQYVCLLEKWTLQKVYLLIFTTF